MKKLTFAIVVLGLSLLLSTGSDAQAAKVAGDANADGVGNILDLTLIVSYFGESIDPAQIPNPGVNGDGSVNILDLDRKWGTRYGNAGRIV